MSGNRRLVLVALSSDPKVETTSSFLHEYWTADGRVLQKEVGLGWAWLFSLSHLLPTHPSMSALASLVDAQLQTYWREEGHCPIVRLYDDWQIPVDVWNGRWKIMDQAMMGWASFERRDVPVELREPWFVTTTASDVAAMFGKHADDFFAQPDDEVSICANGTVRWDGYADVWTLIGAPELYGKLTAQKFIERRKRQSIAATMPPTVADHPFARAAIEGMRALGGTHRSDGRYPWCIDTPIGPLWYSVSPRAIFCRWENVDDAVDQIGQGNVDPNYGKWNHFADATIQAGTAAELLKEIEWTLRRLTPVAKTIEWEGAVRGE